VFKTVCAACFYLVSKIPLVSVYYSMARHCLMPSGALFNSIMQCMQYSVVERFYSQHDV
jgi:hypothetical protein